MARPAELQKNRAVGAYARIFHDARLLWFPNWPSAGWRLYSARAQAIAITLREFKSQRAGSRHQHIAGDFPEHVYGHTAEQNVWQSSSPRAANGHEVGA